MTKRFRLSFVNAAEDVPRLIRAYGRACGGEFALVLRPTESAGILVHLSKDAAAEWRGGEGQDAPAFPTGETTSADAVAAVKEAQKRTGRQGPITLRGQWSGYLHYNNNVPVVELRRKLASYGVLTIASRPEDGVWAWKVDRLERWFGGPGKDTGEAHSLLAAIEAGLGSAMGLLGQVCGHKDSRRRGAYDAQWAERHPVKPAKEGRDPTQRLMPRKRQARKSATSKARKSPEGATVKDGNASAMTDTAAKRARTRAKRVTAGRPSTPSSTKRTSRTSRKGRARPSTKAASTTKPTTHRTSAKLDSDNDGLDDCTEWDLQLNPNIADSDGDGFNDGDEIDCTSNPADPDEVCYSCGWEHNDPGTLEHTGNGEGDTIFNIQMADACGETVDLWDFAGSYHILFLTAEWCGACKAEVNGHDDMLADFRARSDVEADYMVLLFQNNQARPPTWERAEAYANGVRTTGPIFADPGQQSLLYTAYAGDRLPGKCVVSPEMEMLRCWSGKDGDPEAFDLIEAHAAGR